MLQNIYRPGLLENKQINSLSIQSYFLLETCQNNSQPCDPPFRNSIQIVHKILFFRLLLNKKLLHLETKKRMRPKIHRPRLENPHGM